MDEMAYSRGWNQLKEDVMVLINEQRNILKGDLAQALWEAYTRLNQGIEAITKIENGINNKD